MDGTPQFPPGNAPSSSFHREEGFSEASPEVGTKPFFRINIIKGGTNQLCLCVCMLSSQGSMGSALPLRRQGDPQRVPQRSRAGFSYEALCFLHREPSLGCLQFPQIDLRVKSCIEPPETAYCGSGMQGGEESERQSLIKTHQGEIKSPL